MAMKTRHTFVICAYKESEYLRDCIESLKAQTAASKIIMVTSTPNPWIQSMSDRYGIPLLVNEGEAGITQDWNFALSQVKTRYATIAHQDDIYERTYTEKIIRRMRKSKRPLIAFSDYAELRRGEKVRNTTMLRIKRLMLLPLRPWFLKSSRFVRRRVLSLGDPICCPAVTFCMDNLTQPIFANGFQSCEDWEAWEKISRQRGDFIYVTEPLMCHRIHEESTTSALLRDNARAQENYEMYCRFWPKWIAKIINHHYNKSEKFNQLDEKAQ